jgi:hypothetical protein
MPAYCEACSHGTALVPWAFRFSRCSQTHGMKNMPRLPLQGRR